MAIKGIGIVPGADPGMAGCIREMFKNSGIPPENYAIRKVKFAGQFKDKTSEKGSAVQVARLRYQLSTPSISSKSGDTGDKLARLLSGADTLHVVWVGHSSYFTGSNKSIKFSPNHGTDEGDYYLSAKELAKTIYSICMAYGGLPIYPASLTICSCNSGNTRGTDIGEAAARNDAWLGKTARMAISSSEQPLAFRVLDHLRAMHVPPPRAPCVVAAPNRSMGVSELRLIKVLPPAPPGNGDWNATSV